MTHFAQCRKIVNNKEKLTLTMWNNILWINEVYFCYSKNAIRLL